MRAAALLFLLCSPVALAAPVSKLAVPPWTVVNISPELAAFYANEVARELKARGLQVVTSADIAAVLGNERQKALLGCSEDSSSCMAELGSALGCEGILTANLARLGEVYRGSLKVVSASDGATLAEQPVEARNEAALADALGDAAKKIALTLRPPPPFNARPYAVVPFVGGVVLALGAGVAFGVAAKLHGDIPEQTSETAAVGLKGQGEAAQAVAWVAGGVAVGALTTSALIFFLGKPPPVTPQVSVTAGGAQVGVGGRF